MIIIDLVICVITVLAIFCIWVFWLLVFTVKIKNSAIRTLLTIISSLLLTIATINGIQRKEKYIVKNWNNGICTQCEKGTYNLINIIYRKNNNNQYFYMCDNCEHIVHFNRVMK